MLRSFDKLWCLQKHDPVTFRLVKHNGDDLAVIGSKVQACLASEQNVIRFIRAIAKTLLSIQNCRAYALSLKFLGICFGKPLE